METDRQHNNGMIAALLTPFFMGMAPVFGKLAIHAGFDPYTLAAMRTCFAALLLWGVYGLFFRQYTYIFPAGVMGTITVGAVNGIGSLLYYNGLQLLDNASLVQLLNMTYVILVMLVTRIYGHRISALSVFRTVLAFVSVYLLTARSMQGELHWLGVGLVLGGAFMYGLHVVMSQRVMFEMPAPTMTLYALTWMGLTVLIARLIIGPGKGLSWTPAESTGWLFVMGLTSVTALSRLTLFAGVRNLGSLPAALLNMADAGVTLLAGYLWLGESLTPLQWAGVAVLSVSVILSRWDTKVLDHVYRPLPRPSLLRGIIPNEQESQPSYLMLVLQFITKLFRWKLRYKPADFEQADSESEPRQVTTATQPTGKE